MKHQDFLSVLTRLPAMTSEQAGQHFALSSRTLRALARKGLVALSTELVREREMGAPLVVVRPGAPLPSAGEIAYRAQKLWGDALTVRLIVRATAELRALYGGGAASTVRANLSHDIALADVLLNKRHTDPAFQWELVTARPGNGPLPDAISVSGQVLIDLVGRYNGETVAAKLSLCGKGTLELW